MKLGFIGLGRMGGNMAKKLLAEGHSLVVWNRSEPAISNFKFQISNFKLKKEQLKIANSIGELVGSLEKPRVVWSMVPAGGATKQVLLEISKYAGAGDIVIDGGNSFYKDTQKRFEDFKKKGIRFLGIGVSGGIIAAKEGYPMMAGGDKSAYLGVKPLLESLAKPNGGHDYFGQGGAGHFVKMVHNGMEYGIMQSLGEGFDLLKNSPYKFDLLKVARLYQKGTLVSGFMLDRAVEVLQSRIVDGIEGVIDASGEALWTVETAKELGISVEIIEAALTYRQRSKTDKKIQKSYTAKMVAALRHAFGAHSVKKK
ncbi:decarboxylating 6-phosphogluconate dehydrogenase [Candidatus Microgenomates bacterium]|nr:decarboxylating 6-phosphogluconate dehydrogenase [Candidatus Microgenomates bacterium]